SSRAEHTRLTRERSGEEGEPTSGAAARRPFAARFVYAINTRGSLRPTVRWSRASDVEGGAMERSTDRILTSHIGSLVRPPELRELLVDKEQGLAIDDARYEELTRDAVDRIVRRQVEVGLDVVNDGEQGKYSYSTYMRQRLGGLEMVPIDPARPARTGGPMV